MNSIETDILNINKEILNGFSEPILENEITNFISMGSKKIRSRLALLYLKLLDIELDKNIYKILAAGEILHNASLLHDDVIDEACTRRNSTTISKKYSPKISILAGDYLLSYAIEKLLDINNPEILIKFKDCAKLMCKAEIKQFLLRNNIPEIEDYIEICTNKTAQLFKTILESCALYSSQNQTLAGEFGLNFGIYFQIKNDLEKNSAQQDIVNNINTAKNIIGIEKTQILLDNYYEEMLNILSKFPDNIYKRELRDLLKNYDR